MIFGYTNCVEIWLNIPSHMQFYPICCMSLLKPHISSPFGSSTYWWIKTCPGTKVTYMYCLKGIEHRLVNLGIVNVVNHMLYDIVTDTPTNINKQYFHAWLSSFSTLAYWWIKTWVGVQRLHINKHKYVFFKGH